MQTIMFRGKSYRLSDNDFLFDHEDWDEDFVEAMALRLKMPGGPSHLHWAVIWYIRNSVETSGLCPTLAQVCKALKLRYREFEALFPLGYLHGACRMAGLTFKERYPRSWWPAGDEVVATA